MNRRNFIKGAAAGVALGYFAASGISSTVFRKSLVSPPPIGTLDIGEVKGIKVTVITETSWFNNDVLLDDIKKAGGILANQWEMDWTYEGVEDGFNGNNAGGYSALIEIEALDGTNKKYLLDTGWNVEWMEHRFAVEGIDKMLKNKEIEALIISHEHFDHYWGLPAVTKHYPDIPMYIPSTFYNEGMEFLKKSGHTGSVTKIEPGEIKHIIPGFVISTFDVPIITRVRGEQILFFNIKDKGLATVTGCCHPGIITILQFAKKTFKGGDRVYAVYGGLHISPFEDWDPQFDDVLLSIKDYGIEKLGCNHCTGYVTVEKMLDLNLPVIQGTGRNKTKRNIYLGNGDQLVL